MKLKLGTRRSLLAWAQSSAVAREVEKLNPGVSVELVGIETQGDRILDVPLRKIEGKEFFVAELDHALNEGLVDFCVHSMKDLSLERPQNFVIAATPPRENPRDVVIFHNRVVDFISRGEKISVGTSSPRRLENIPSFLRKALPHKDREVLLEMVEIRGNVNTRLSRLHETGEKKLDGVVLAAAGLSRLWQDEKAKIELTTLLKSTQFMMLPLSASPGAPAQGVLAVECRRNDDRVYGAIRKIHCSVTESLVQKERAVLAEWGGGCHQRFGAACIDTETAMGPVLIIKGVRSDLESPQQVDERRMTNLPRLLNKEVAFYSSSEYRMVQEEFLKLDQVRLSQIAGAKIVLVSHSRALSKDLISSLSGKRVYTSGVSTWVALASQGIWVEGSADGWGEKHLRWLIQKSPWSIENRSTDSASIVNLTHDHANEFSGDCVNSSIIPLKNVSTYSITPRHHSLAELPTEIRSKILNATYFYWTSGSQYQAYSKLLNWNETQRNSFVHSCGPGKTAAYLEKLGLSPRVFPSEKEWLEWVQPANRKN